MSQSTHAPVLPKPPPPSISILKGWHPGEHVIQEKLGVHDAVAENWRWIDGKLAEDVREFYTTRLPWIPITTLDAEGRPWASYAAGVDGEQGFARDLGQSRLRMDVKAIPGDPLVENVKLFGHGGSEGVTLVAGLGIDFGTRRRNKFAGHITSVSRKDDELELVFEANQSLAACPKYINHRDLVPHPEIHPKVVYKNLILSDSDRLPDDLIDLIHTSDTVALATSYRAKSEDTRKYPSHVGHNLRGGRQGFVRVLRSDGRTVVMPDYSGNRLMQSLGNIEYTPLAGLTFVSFTDGNILYLTGKARTLVGKEAQAIMPRQNVVTTVYITGFVFIRDALTVRQRPGTKIERSPYSPPIKLLAEELEGTTSALFDDEMTATLASVDIHSKDLATFTWTTSEPLLIQAGQTAVLDFKNLLGSTQYSHMAPWNPASINDDRIRTWTVSSAAIPPEKSSQFKLTMQEKEEGAVTGFLFNIARKLAEQGPESLKDATELEIKVPLVGIVGEFTLEDVSDKTTARKPMLWFAGGIGITPYLAMLNALTSPMLQASSAPSSINLVATREPDVLIPLVLPSIHSTDNNHANIHLTIDIFTATAFTPPSMPSTSSAIAVDFRIHSGRVDEAYVNTIPDVADKKVYLCGPPAFERAVLSGLSARGLDASKVIREGFGY
ncbi:hypothetical protein EIP91_001817 [Steccherinum ochraceum]|uniref:FAD-binding FR-type domain-containing protein n=1 Tax=Steccherinum ochraceum TaxID=92696 RepID=A0A4R0RSF0_9APHY|nr:hypothetical protein EIP91_001817 [Steccherinum ochraceum]